MVSDSFLVIACRLFVIVRLCAPVLYLTTSIYLRSPTLYVGDDCQLQDTTLSSKLFVLLISFLQQYQHLRTIGCHCINPIKHREPYRALKPAEPLAEGLKNVILAFCFAAVATYVMLHVHDAENNLPTFVLVN